ncbi:MAG: M61 family metallopeptidase [Cecembia sp.]
MLKINQIAMHYHIARQSPASQFIQVQLTLDCRAGETIHLQLAAWRPGRYELANYAQKIRSFKVHHKELPLKWQKKSKDLWYFSAQETGTYQVTYEYYCNQMDAGGCWLDDIQLYLNFSNFIFDVKERSNEAISLSIALPENYQVATALPNKGHGRWEASGYQHLMDSPLLAAVELQHFDYQVAGHQFHLWFHGEIHFDIAQLIKDFKAFTKKQIEAFGALPAEHYHFIFQLLPYKHYHGVEHAYSTVITYGPASALAQKSELDELVGVSSHELYHFWNVCRIRPKELIPYDLSNEVYLDTGLVLEGVTTYMGDHFLLESGYFSLEDYLKILQKQIQKEVDHQGWENQNILESSFDLWLDGYKPGIPDKKVNIYNRGALIALCLDLMLKSGESSLSQVMKKMWESFGSTGQGYVLDDFYSMLCQSTENSQPIKAFWEDYVLGKGELILPLTKLLANIGVRLTFHDEGDTILHAYGIRKDENGKVLQVHPEADAYSKVMINDLLSYDSGMSKSDKADALEIVLERQGRKLETIIYKGNKSLYPKVKLEILQK